MLSLAAELARLPERQRAGIVSDFSEAEAAALLADWQVWARPEQITPAGDWRIWLILAGRGWGKTRAAAEDVAGFGRQHPDSRIAVVAPTYSDARDTCVEGESGLLAIIPRDEVRLWNRSMGELILKNGTRYKLFSADEPDRMRGPQHHRAWLDEIASWTRPEAFDMLMFGLRLGADPRCVISTTPRPTKLVRDLVGRIGQDVVKSGGSTFDNSANLAPAFVDAIVRRYGSTRLGRQEIEAQVLEDRAGALWQRSQLDALRVTEAPPFRRVVVGVDPSVSDGEESAECGIIVAAIGADGHGYVLDDASLRESPLGWARAVVAAVSKFKADRVIAEKNQGGAMVESTLRTVAPHLPYKGVHASRNKEARAEPVSALYEQGKVHHLGSFPLLEDQMVEWVPGEKSPDRMDALVWAFTELFNLSEPAPNPLAGLHVGIGVRGWMAR